MSKTEWLSAPGSPRNEAAERLVADGLRQRMGWGAADPRYVRTMQDVREALAAERRATAERIRDRIIGARPFDTVTVDGVIHRRHRPARYAVDSYPMENIDRILEEEAAR